MTPPDIFYYSIGGGSLSVILGKTRRPRRFSNLVVFPWAIKMKYRGPLTLWMIFGLEPSTDLRNDLGPMGLGRSGDPSRGHAEYHPKCSGPPILHIRNIFWSANRAFGRVCGADLGRFSACRRFGRISEGGPLITHLDREIECTRRGTAQRSPAGGGTPPALNLVMSSLVQREPQPAPAQALWRQAACIRFGHILMGGGL